jgi:phosphoglucosamine mutase
VQRRYFGTDGVRGVAGSPPLTAEWVVRLGQAAGLVIGAAHPRPTVVVGRDPRASGPMLEAALTAGLLSSGTEVLSVGVLPTAGISYLTRKHGAQAGVVISASHNPAQDNGIKFFGNSGEKLSDPLELEIEQAIDQPAGPARFGRLHHHPGAAQEYADFLSGQASDLSGLKVAMDCANGAAHQIAPEVFQRAGADLFAIYAHPDGQNINRNCGSTHLQRLQEVVRSGDFELGLAFDGDADRVLFVDAAGRVVHGDHMLYLLAQAKRPPLVVSTVMANMGLEVALQGMGIRLGRSQVGDRYVHEQMLASGALLGGEPSGHILLLELGPTGDGIQTALQVLAALGRSELTMAELHDSLTMYPQRLVSLRYRDRERLLGDPRLRATLDEAEKQLGGRGRVNLRFSGTEPLIRIMVEGEDEAEVERLLAELVASVQAADAVRA